VPPFQQGLVWGARRLEIQLLRVATVNRSVLIEAATSANTPYTNKIPLAVTPPSERLLNQQKKFKIADTCVLFALAHDACRRQGERQVLKPAHLLQSQRTEIFLI
jgi:hypothetical protein